MAHLCARVCVCECERLIIWACFDGLFSLLCHSRGDILDERHFFFFFFASLDYARRWGGGRQWMIPDKLKNHCWGFFFFFWNWQKKIKNVKWIKSLLSSRRREQTGKINSFLKNSARIQLLFFLIFPTESGWKKKVCLFSSLAFLKPCLWLRHVLQEYLRFTFSRCPGRSINCIACCPSVSEWKGYRLVRGEILWGECQRVKDEGGMRKRKSLSLISITSHYLPFSRRSLQDTLTHTHTHTHIRTCTHKYRYCTVVSLRLDRQLDTEIDGLLSKFKGGARGV